MFPNKTSPQRVDYSWFSAHTSLLSPCICTCRFLCTQFSSFSLGLANSYSFFLIQFRQCAFPEAFPDPAGEVKSLLLFSNCVLCTAPLQHMHWIVFMVSVSSSVSYELLECRLVCSLPNTSWLSQGLTQSRSLMNAFFEWMSKEMNEGL